MEHTYYLDIRMQGRGAFRAPKLFNVERDSSIMGKCGEGAGRLRDPYELKQMQVAADESKS